MSFQTEDDLDAKIWIWENQIKKRNLSDEYKMKGALALEGLYKEKAVQNSANDNGYGSDCWETNSGSTEKKQEKQELK